MTYSNLPDRNEKFTTEVILPWNGQHRLIEDDWDMQDIFMVFRGKQLNTIRINIQLLQMATVDPEVIVNSKPHTPVDSYSCNNDVDIASNNNSDDVPGNEANGNQHEVDNDINTDYDQDNSDDESQTRPYVPKPGRPYMVADDGKIYLQVEQMFQNLYHFRMVLRDFGVQEGFQIHRVKNEKDRYTAICAFEGCTWRVHASPNTDKTCFQIKSLHDRHACQKVHKNQEANVVWVANRFKSLIKENLDININFLGSEIHRIYGITIPTWTLYRAKNRVLDSTTIEYAECYDKLYSYGHMGFILGCRPFIGLDGCHLKGKFPGVIMDATAIDANFGVFPVAVAIVRGQTALTLLENIRRAIMKRIHKRDEDAKKWSEFEYEVKDKNNYYNVHLGLKTCNCRYWAISGIPCKHAMAVITNTRRQCHEYVHSYLIKDSYIKTYSNVIHQIPYQSLWPKMTFNKLFPPDRKKLPGRPRKNRKRAPDEPTKQKMSSGGKCSGCGSFGHNVRSCKTKQGNANQGSSVRVGSISNSASKKKKKTINEILGPGKAVVQRRM
ncbi:hypothetical protein Ddye_008148 [Dipteronia dyeriana]|uniref:SWIM-type domain-containing protein n=1 Tax=Dipteronia dyeriana TaxID=168575 RepID=A0AAD9X8V0_9ROSI|nr:hypothetical protein Ddye_008148 [Dipteronia dyeriana]